MVFPILGANTESAAYEIENSLRFDDSNYLTRDNTTQSGGGTNFTFSAWLKMSTYGDGGYQGIFSIFKDSNDYFEIYKDNSEKLQICQNINGTNVCYQNQDFVYRDYSAWYHLVVSFDNSASGEINKIKTYVNGQEISADEKVTNSNPFADVGLGDSAYDTRVGAYRDNTSATWNGYMADVHLIAGQTLAASYFGETNNNGVWVPKEYTGTFGDNGFFLEFKQTGTSQNSSGMGADTSGEDNHLAVTGLSSIDVTVDTPTNNFCTMNPIAADPHTTLAEGNLKWTSGGNGGVVGTMAVSNGKWYWECKGVDVGADSQLGIWQTSKDTGYPLDQYVGTGESWGYVTFSGKNIHNDSQSAAITTLSDNDIMMFALDMDNLKLWFGINGTWTQSGNPATGANANHTGITDEFMTPAIASFSGSSGYDWRFNFGNPIVSISSGNADANGYGNFEYAPPSGFYSLCTKNLAEYG